MGKKVNLTEEQRHEIFVLRGCVKKCELAKRFGVSAVTIDNIQNPKKYQERLRKMSGKGLTEAQRKAKKLYDDRKRYGIQNVEELKNLQVWNTELGIRVVLVEGQGRFNLYDGEGNLRNKLKLTTKVADCDDFAIAGVLVSGRENG